MFAYSRAYKRSYAHTICISYSDTFTFLSFFARVKELPCVCIDERPPTFSTHMLLPLRASFFLRFYLIRVTYTCYHQDDNFKPSKSRPFFSHFLCKTIIKRPSCRSIFIEKVSSRGIHTYWVELSYFNSLI